MFVGAKMLGSSYFEISTLATLGFVGAVLAASVGASLMHPKKGRSA
jgi:hypothetical protein